MRFASTSTSTTLASKDFGPIPEPPVPIPETEWASQVSPISSTIQSTTINGGEPPFESIGLGGWTPVGMVQNCLEYLHISCDLPWWTTIIIGTYIYINTFVMLHAIHFALTLYYNIFLIIVE